MATMLQSAVKPTEKSLLGVVHICVYVHMWLGRETNILRNGCGEAK